MAYDKVVDSSVLDAGLTAIADAIRAKAGTSDSLAFPTAMAEAIAAIEAGGGGNSLLGHPFVSGSVRPESQTTQITSVLTEQELIDIFGAVPPAGSFLGAWWRADGYTATAYTPAFGIGFPSEGRSYAYAPAIGIDSSGAYAATKLCNVIGILGGSRGFYISTGSPYSFVAGEAYNWILVDLSQEV